MSKNEIKICFPDLYSLWSFAQSIRVSTMEIRTAEKILICRCSEEDISLAVKKYNAEILVERIELTGMSEFKTQN